MRFAINHISAPGMPLAEFFAMNRRLGVSEVEIRNDIPDIVGSMAPRAVRAEAEAIAAITETGDDGTYRLMHDTFHHHLAGETAFYPNRTGLVHISGVTDSAVAVDDMLDAHRVLVDGADRLENIEQIRALQAGGYAGPFSFEPFAQQVHNLDDPEAALRESMDHIRAALA